MSKRFSLNLSLSKPLPTFSSNTSSNNAFGGSAPNLALPSPSANDRPSSAPSTPSGETVQQIYPVGVGEKRDTGYLLVEREQLYRQLKALENLLQHLSSYQMLLSSLAKTESKLSKGLKDVYSYTATDAKNPSCGSAEVISNSLLSSSSLFSSQSTITSRHAKLIASELSSLSSLLATHFKATAKKEAKHDDHVAACDSKIKKAGASYEKAAKGGKTSGAEVGSKHDKYIGTLRALGEEISLAKEAHLHQTSHMQTLALLSTSSAVTSLASSLFTASTESCRKTAPFVGDVQRWRCLAEAGWVGMGGLNGLQLEGWQTGQQDVGPGGEEGEYGFGGELLPPRSLGGTPTSMVPPYASALFQQQATSPARHRSPNVPQASLANLPPSSYAQPHQASPSQSSSLSQQPIQAPPRVTPSPASSNHSLLPPVTNTAIVASPKVSPRLAALPISPLAQPNERQRSSSYNLEQQPDASQAYERRRGSDQQQQPERQHTSSPEIHEAITPALKSGAFVVNPEPAVLVAEDPAATGGRKWGFGGARKKVTIDESGDEARALEKERASQREREQIEEDARRKLLEEQRIEKDEKLERQRLLKAAAEEEDRRMAAEGRRLEEKRLAEEEQMRLQQRVAEEEERERMRAMEEERKRALEQQRADYVRAREREDAERIMRERERYEREEAAAAAAAAREAQMEREERTLALEREERRREDLEWEAQRRREMERDRLRQMERERERERSVESSGSKIKDLKGRWEDVTKGHSTPPIMPSSSSAPSAVSSPGSSSGLGRKVSLLSQHFDSATSSLPPLLTPPNLTHRSVTSPNYPPSSPRLPPPRSYNRNASFSPDDNVRPLQSFKSPAVLSSDRELPNIPPPNNRRLSFPVASRSNVDQQITSPHSNRVSFDLGRDQSRHGEMARDQRFQVERYEEDAELIEGDLRFRAPTAADRERDEDEGRYGSRPGRGW